MTRTEVFVGVIAVLLGVAVVAARNARGKESMLVARGGVSTAGNGLAIIGEFASVATFLGLVGGVALNGFDGFVPVLGVPLGFLLLLVVVAEPLRRLGHFTVGDMIARRMPDRRLRVLLGVTGLVISAVYMVVQFVGAAVVVGSSFGLSYPIATTIIAALTLVLVLIGGMTSATAVQVVKSVLLLVASAVLVVLALHRADWAPLQLARAGADAQAATAAPPAPGGVARGVDNLSAVIATVFGVSGMPHIMVRLLTVRTGRAARRSAMAALVVMSVYLVVMVFVGYAAAAFVTPPVIAAANPAGNTAAVQLAADLGGELFAALVVGLIFAIVAAVLAGLLVAMIGIIAHDLYGSAGTAAGRRADDRRQVAVARLGAVGIVVLVGAMAMGFRNVNLIFVGVFAFGIAASTIFPVVLLTLYWRRFTLTGATAAVSVGLATSLLGLVVGPNVLGAHALLPISQPAVLTIPLAFLAAGVGTRLSSRRSPAVRTVGVGT